MAEYIEREETIKTVVEMAVEIFDCHTTVPLLKFANKIRTIPTADVVEVVRCKECKHYEIHRPSVTLNCEREGKLIPMNPTDFCSYGMKKEGVNND